MRLFLHKPCLSLNVAIYILALLPACVQASEDRILADAMYHDPKGLFSIVPPKGWKVIEYREDPRGKVAFNWGKARLGIIVQNDGIANIDELISLGKDIEKRIGVNTNIEKTTIAGHPAIKRSFKSKGYRFIAYDFLVDSTTHNLQYSAPPGLFAKGLAKATASMETYSPALHRSDRTVADEHQAAKKLRLAQLMLNDNNPALALTFAKEGLEWSPQHRELQDLVRKIEDKANSHGSTAHPQSDSMILSLEPDVIQELARSFSLINSNDDKAKSVLVDVLSVSPGNPIALNNMGYLEFSQLYEMRKSKKHRGHLSPSEKDKLDRAIDYFHAALKAAGNTLIHPEVKGKALKGEPVVAAAPLQEQSKGKSAILGLILENIASIEKIFDVPEETWNYAASIALAPKIVSGRVASKTGQSHSGRQIWLLVGKTTGDGKFEFNRDVSTEGTFMDPSDTIGRDGTFSIPIADSHPILGKLNDTTVLLMLSDAKTSGENSKQKATILCKGDEHFIFNVDKNEKITETGKVFDACL